MNEYVFNSLHEFSYRILLLLDAHGSQKASVDRLTSLDFICVYGNDFTISEENLHGNNRFRFSEYAGRRKSVNEALKALVVLGYVQFHALKKGFLYSITPSGQQFCLTLNDIYATKYLVNAAAAIKYAFNMSDRELTKTINDYSIVVAREG